MLKTLVKISYYIQKFIEYFLLFIGTLLTLVNLAQIAGRSLFFYSLPWSEQLSTWLFVWIIFLGYHLVLIKDSELSIDAIHFSDRKKQLCLEIVRDLFSLIMIGVFLVASIQFMDNAIKFPQRLSSMPVMMYVIYAIMPFSFSSVSTHRYGTGAATPKVIRTSSRIFFSVSTLLTTLQLNVAISIAFRIEYLI